MVRERVVQLAVKRNHFATGSFQNLRREGACCPVSTGRDNFQRAGEFWPVAQIFDIGIAYFRMEDVISASRCL